MEPCRLAFALYRWRRFIMRLIGRYAWLSLQLNCGFCGSCPFHIPFNCFGGGLEISSQDHGRPAGDGPLPLAARSGQLSLHLTESAGVAQVPSVGWKLELMKDSILSGLLAAKASRGISMKLKTAALEEARASVEKEKKQGHQKQFLQEAG